jgi:hypothetical protein
MVLTALAASMAVNALVTGLIVFKILKVFLGVRPTSVEQSLGRSTEDTKLQHVIFVIIESGIALFTIQLLRVVFTSMLDELPAQAPAVNTAASALDFVIGIHEMFNVIIRSFPFLLLVFF